MKTREVSMGEKTSNCEAERRCKINQTIAQTLAIASTTIWNLLRKKETTGVLSNTPRTARSRKTSAVEDRNIVTAVKKDPKTSVSYISNNLQRQEWRYHLLFAEDFMNKSTEATPEDANHSLARRIGDEPQTFWDKVLWTDFMDQSDGKAKVWRKKDLLMIPNIQAHLKHSGGNVGLGFHRFFWDRLVNLH